ncbi:MAG: hypothetical protein OEM25_06180 [Gammaproteobacteria bacterium]|nr:hypothetical protein [Gammaproteobacteria bacterium]
MGLSLYTAECKNSKTVAAYGKGTPNDGIETHLYARYRYLGLALMLMVDAALFGWAGLIVFAVQMVWIPFWAAGVINGIGHFWGLRIDNRPGCRTSGGSLISVGFIFDCSG